MLDQQTSVINDLKIVMNKMNDHNKTTIHIFSNMKEQVSVHTNDGFKNILKN